MRNLEQRHEDWCKRNFIPHKVNLQKNFICAWYTQDSDMNLIDDINSYMDYCKQNDMVSEGTIYNSDENGNHLQFTDHKVKYSLDARMDPSSGNAGFDRLEDYLLYVSDIYTGYIFEYPYCLYNPSFGITEGINIQEYPPNEGGFHLLHHERSRTRTNREMVYMTYLNDVEDGGETYFYHQDIKIKPEKGLTVIFPADWKFLHKGMPSSSTKRIVTGWLSWF
jgi:hypothetical protein